MSSSELQTYLTSIGRLPVLCKEAQLRHCQRIHAWVNWPGGRHAAPERVRRSGQRSMDVMITTNARLVVSIAKRYQGRGMELLDLIQEGSLGLVRGLELFDPTRGYAVSTYCYWWIRQAVTRAINTYARPIRLPISTYEALHRARRFASEYQAQHGRTPSLEEVAAHCDATPERMLALFDQHETTVCRSLDALCTEDGNPLIDMIGHDPTDTTHVQIQLADDTAALRAAFAELPLSEAKVLTAVFFEEQPLSAVAPKLGVTRSRAGQIQRAGLQRLRGALEPRTKPRRAT